MLDYIPIALLILAVILQLFKGRKIVQQDIFTTLILLAIALGTLAQLYLLFDPWHLRLIAPVIILCLVLLRTEVKIQAPYSKSIAYISAEETFALRVGFISGLNSQTSEFKSLVPAGMASSRRGAVATDKTMLALGRVGIESQSARFICNDGLYASATQEYLSRGPSFLDWGLDESLLDSHIELIFVCDYTQNEIDNYLNSGWDGIFLLSSGHTNQKGELLFNALMKRE